MPAIPTIALDFKDDAMHRTVFYERFLAAVARSPSFVEDPDHADLIFPAEDTAVETNWPRYGLGETAYVRGKFDPKIHLAYLRRLTQVRRPLCVINMHPGIRLPTALQANASILVADINLRAFERTFNPRTVSMPALPIGIARNPGPARTLVASFRGVSSHPVRQRLAEIADGKRIVVELVDRLNHVGKLDAEKKQSDPAYLALLESSSFAFVPRGDAEFSYRLLEVMSAGCIPVVLADGLVLPFDRTIDWSTCSLHVSESKVLELPAMLAGIPPAQISDMQANAAKVYATVFSSLEAILAQLLTEAAIILART